MRYLKTKLLRAKEARERSLNINSSTAIHSPTSSDDLCSCSPILQSQLCSILNQDISADNSKQTRRSTRIENRVAAQKVDDSKQTQRLTRNELAVDVMSPTKNISINYGKVISSFAISALAVPYLQPFLDQEEVSLDDFVLFVNQAREKIGGISSFRSLLIIDEKVDTTKTMTLKKIFKMISEVFIKNFSVNWITHGKVTHKLVYLKFRSKMLRRVQNPELFTYVRRRELNSKLNNDLNSNVNHYDW